MGLFKTLFENKDENIQQILKYVGKNNHVPDSEFDPEELKMGIRVEYEHTDNYAISKAIAKDHLAELPDYYTRLKEIDPNH